MSCRRPSNRSSRLALPLGPSNSYSFSTASHGIRRRSAAIASRARVTAFSFTRSCRRSIALTLFLSMSLSSFRLFLPRSLLTISVAMPPVEVAPAAVRASVVTHPGHIVRLLGPGSRGSSSHSYGVPEEGVSTGTPRESAAPFQQESPDRRILGETDRAVVRLHRVGALAHLPQQVCAHGPEG